MEKFEGDEKSWSQIRSIAECNENKATSSFGRLYNFSFSLFAWAKQSLKMGLLFMNSPLSSLGKLSSVNKRNNQRAGFLSSQEDTPRSLQWFVVWWSDINQAVNLGIVGVCAITPYFSEGTFQAYSIRCVGGRWARDEVRNCGQCSN